MSLNWKNLSIYFGIGLLTTGISYYGFRALLPVSSPSNNQTTQDSNSAPTTTKTGVIQFSGPRTEACPLNGQLYTKEEKNIWSKRRPLMVMIENHDQARPQSGLENADIVYEAMAEGGITRFMGVFYCGAVDGAPNKYDVGPVRSARTYFLDLASEYADYPLYTHVGGANCSAATVGGPCTTNRQAQALEQIDQYGWTSKGTWSDMNEFSLTYKICRREPERTGTVKDTEHTMYCNTSELWNLAADRGLANTTSAKNNVSWDKNYRPWMFKAPDTPNSAATSPKISFDYWTGYKAYSVQWDYDSSKNVYLRSNGGQKHIDFNTGNQLFTKNVVIEYVKETRSIDEHAHNLETVVGTGTGILFQNGGSTPITWSKANRVSRTIYKDKSGKEVNFVPGQVWVEILPIGSNVSYEGQS